MLQGNTAEVIIIDDIEDEEPEGYGCIDDERHNFRYLGTAGDGTSFHKCTRCGHVWEN